MDKCKVSDRNAVHILIATAEEFELDLNDLIISRSSIHRIREQLRSEHTKNLREIFLENNVNSTVFHWDGKLLSSLTSKNFVNRLPIIISFNANEQLLSVPFIKTESGKDQAFAIYIVLLEWNIMDKVRAYCCDTIASNTGRLD